MTNFNAPPRNLNVEAYMYINSNPNPNPNPNPYPTLNQKPNYKALSLWRGINAGARAYCRVAHKMSRHMCIYQVSFVEVTT